MQLASGEILRADIIIGADGERGLCRRLVLGREERVRPSGIAMFEYVYFLSPPSDSLTLRQRTQHPIWVADSNTGDVAR